MLNSGDAKTAMIYDSFEKAIRGHVQINNESTAYWKKASEPSSGDHNVKTELKAAITSICQYLESSAGKRFLETKTDIDNPNKIANLFDDAVAGVNALIGNLSISNAKELKEQIYTQLVDAVSKQYPGYKLTGQDVKNAAKNSEAELVTQLNTNNKKVDCGGAGNCGPLSILGALNMASVVVSDPALQKVINNFKKDDHQAATELRKALVAYIKKPGNVDGEEKEALFMVPIGASVDTGLVTGNAEEGYFYKSEAYFKELLNINHWFSDAEMNLVAKMLNINIVVAVQGHGGTTIQRKETQDENPAGTIYLYNYEGAHYQAYPDKNHATIAPRTTKPLSDTREPEPERSPSPTTTLTLQQQTKEVAQLVEGLKTTLMDQENIQTNAKKFDAAILSMFDKIKEEVQADTKLEKEVQSIIDLLEKVKIKLGEEIEFSEVLKVHRQAQSLLDKVGFATLASDSPIRVALQAYISSPCDVMCVSLPIVVNQSIKEIKNDNEFSELLGGLYVVANDAASQFPKSKNTALMAAASALKHVYSVGEISDEELEIPYEPGQHPNINQINDAQIELNHAIRYSEIKKEDPLCKIMQTAITCALQVVKKYNELHPDVAIKSTAATVAAKKTPVPKHVTIVNHTKLNEVTVFVKTLSANLERAEYPTAGDVSKVNEHVRKIAKTLGEAYDLAMLALQDEKAKPVAIVIEMIFDERGKIPNEAYVHFASGKIDALELETDDPIKIALQTAVEAALVAIEANQKINKIVPTTTLTPAALGSSSSLSASEEDRNPGFLYLEPILDKTITPANNEKQASKKIYECALMLQGLLDQNPHMKSNRIEALRNLCLSFSIGDVSVNDFKTTFNELSEGVFRSLDEPWKLLEALQSRKDKIFNYVDIIAQSKLTSSLPILEQAFVIPKEMNNNSDLEKFEFLLDKFGATLEVIQKTIELEHPEFAMLSEEFCEQIEKFVKGDEDANDLEDIEGLFDEVLKKSDIPPAVKTILGNNRGYITEALTRIQDSRDNAVTLQSNDSKITNGVFEKFLDVYYGEFGPSKEFRSIKDSSGSITLHNKTKGDKYEPTPLVTFTASTKPAAPGVTPFADCKFSDIYAGAKAAFIVMSKFKAENPSAECSVDNPKLNSDADYKNFLQALYDANKSADGKYMMNEVKINFTDANIRQKFINILSGTIDVGLNTKVVAALKDNFGPPKTFEYTGTRMPRPPRATKTVQLKTQGIFTDADYQPKPAATVTAPTTAVTSTRPTSSSL